MKTYVRMTSIPDARPITTEAELRALIPEPNSKVRLKILDTLERHSQHMIAMSSVVALSCTADEGATCVSLITTRGTIVPQGDRTLRIDDPHHALRDAWKLGEGVQRGVGGLFMVGGIEETLRVNGIASRCPSEDAGVAIEVDEAFLQCPKAFVRSRLWDPATWTADPSPIGAHDREPSKALTPSMVTFIERSPFAVVCTESADGHGDISPRGDPAGLFVRRLDDGTLLLPDRTGNQLVDTLRNILSRPRATIVFVIPGTKDAVQVRARARITADAALLAPSAVKGKPPKVGILLEVEDARTLPDSLHEVWNAESLVDPKDFPTMGEMILDQVNPGGKTLNKIGSKIFDLASSYHKRRRLY